MTTITLPRATVEQALEALEWSWGGEPMGTLERDAITALRAALAQQAEAVEPVAWMYSDDYAGILKHQSRAEVFQKAWCNPAVCVPLYTAPPQPLNLSDSAVQKRLAAQWGYVKAAPAWCEIHQHNKWCEHNGGVMGPTGWEKP